MATQAPQAPQTQTSSEPMPSASVLLQAAKLALAQDKPILLDYFLDTANNKAFLGEDQESKDKMLVKSVDEFTSLVQKAYKVGNEYIIMTENSIYITHGNMQKRKIQASSLKHE